MRRDAFIGAHEVDQLVGKWQTITGGAPWQGIVGASPWLDVVGADVQYANPYAPQGQGPWGRHRHHHRRPWWETGGGSQYGGGQYDVRDHRAYVMGDPTVGAYALLGADPATGAPIIAPVPPGGAPHPLGPPPGPPIAPIVVPHPAAPAATPVSVAPPATASPEVPPEHPAHPDHHLPPNHPGHPAHPTHPHHRRYRATGWAPAMSAWGATNEAWPYMIPPRNLLVDRPGPTGADRVILPMSSGVNILPNTSAQITSRPQNYAFRPERVIISGSADWVINDIKVGNMSQFSQSGDVPGEMFGATTIDGFVKFTTCQTAMDFVIVTTFVGTSESGAPFVCGVLGTAAVN